MSSLAKTNEPWLLYRYLEFSKNEDYVRSQDFFTVWKYIAGNPVGNPIIWNYYRQNWDYLVNRFTLNDRYLGRVIKSITNGFTTKFQLKEVSQFYAQYPDAGAGKRAREQALEKVNSNIKWLDNNYNNVENWLHTWAEDHQ